MLVAADRLEDVLQAVEASPGRPLVVTPASRPDVVLGLAAAQVPRTSFNLIPPTPTPS